MNLWDPSSYGKANDKTTGTLDFTYLPGRQRKAKPCLRRMAIWLLETRTDIGPRPEIALKTALHIASPWGDPSKKATASGGGAGLTTSGRGFETAVWRPVPSPPAMAATAGLIPSRRGLRRRAGFAATLERRDQSACQRQIGGLAGRGGPGPRLATGRGHA